MNPIIGLVKGVAEPLIDRLVPDKNARAEAKEQLEADLLAALTAQDMGQMEVNKAEAAHSSIFVAGWRPFIGWVCGVALVWNFVLYPIAMWGVWLFPEYQEIIESAPKLNASELITVLLGMLGLGGLRTYEKRIGVARSTMQE